MKHRMIHLARIATLGAAVSLSACGSTEPPATPSPSTTTGGNAPAVDHTQMTVEPDTASALSLRCGNAVADLHSTGPTSAQASFTLPGEPAHALAIPEALAGYSALGMGCTTAADGTPFLVVQYGELPYGCQFCEWYALYDHQGQLLTQNTPALLGEGEDRQPNNQQYETLLARHGLQHPAMEFAGQ